MGKPQTMSVQSVANQTQLVAGNQRAGRALVVHEIADDRAVQALHMYTNLMSSSCKKINLQKSKTMRGIQDTINTLGPPAIFYYAHHLAIVRVSAHRGHNPTL